MSSNTWRNSASFDEVKDKIFHIVNGQRTLAACLEYVNDITNTYEMKDFLFAEWQYNMVWAPKGNDDLLFHFSGVLNMENAYRKHFPSWVECIQHARKTWTK